MKAPRPVRLSSTSALVLLWAQQECYRGTRARDYLGQLDLDEGRDLYERCREICPYYDEVIKNRKFGVFHLVGQCLATDAGNPQLVIAGAGFDALGIAVAELYPHVKVFELDEENMNVKARLATPLCRGIAFIETNLLDAADVRRSLSARGWDPVGTTLLVLEGISYYLPTGSIQKLVRVTDPRWMIFEFLKQDEDIAAERVHIPRQVFGLISSLCGLSHIGRYRTCQLAQLFGDLSVSARYSMKRLEEMRTGANRFFPTEDSGWIEVCLLAHQ
jgi:hypothetical protein